MPGQSTPVANLNRVSVEAASSRPGEFAPAGGIFFAATTIAAGRELWYVDAAGVRQVADLFAGADSSSPRSLTPFGTGVAFAAETAAGTTLWIVDRPNRPVRPLRDTAGGDVQEPQHLVAVGRYLYFTAESVGAGRELWLTDGSPAGARVVADIRPGPIGSMPQGLVAFAGGIAFVADDGTHGSELWVSDGTAGGTRMVADLYPGPEAGASVQPPAALGSRLVFAGRDPAAGAEPWVSDGTAGGTSRLADLTPGPADSRPRGFTTAGSRVVFAAMGASGDEPYATDATVAGTGLLADLLPGPLSSAPADFAASGDGRVFFSSALAQREYVTDGTPAGTAAIPMSSGGGVLGAGGGVLYFRGVDDSLRVADGRGGASVGLPVAVPRDSALLALAVGGAWLAGRSADTGVELWRTDGTPAGTRLVADIEPTRGDAGSDPDFLATVAGRVVISATTGSASRHLFGSDGSAAGTVDLGQQARRWHLVAAMDDWVLLAGDGGGVAPDVLLRSDGTFGGTFPLPALAAMDPTPPIQKHGCALDGTRAVFAGVAGISTDAEPWISDGTVAGTRRLRDIAIGSSSMPRDFVRAGGKVFFAADDVQSGRQVWVTDGSTNGTRLTRAVDVSGFGPKPLVGAGGRAVFLADDGVHGVEPWVTDGTVSGTQLLLDSAPGPIGVTSLAQATTGAFGVLRLTVGVGHLMVATDGTPGAAVVLPIPNLGRLALVAQGDRVAALAWDGAGTRVELYTTDGTATGTVRAPVALPQRMPVHVREVSDSTLAYSYFDGQLGLVLTDGTSAATRVLPPFFSRAPGQAAGALFVAVDDGVHGAEPHLVLLGANSQRQGISCGGLSLVTTEPRLGQTMDLRLRRRAGGALGGAILFGAAADLPLRLPLGSGCVSFVDPAAPSVGLAVPASGLSLALPVALNLLGRTVAAQGLALIAPGVLGSSNGQRLSLDF